MAKSRKTESELLDAALEHYDALVMMYESFPGGPIMLFDVQEMRIYAYPYQEFWESLNERSQILLKQQYEEAQQEGKFVLFVKDNVKQKMQSFTLDIESGC